MLGKYNQRWQQQPAACPGQADFYPDYCTSLLGQAGIAVCRKIQTSKISSQNFVHAGIMPSVFAGVFVMCAQNLNFKTCTRRVSALIIMQR